MEFNVTDKQTRSHTIKSSIRKVNQAFGYEALKKGIDTYFVFTVY